VINVVEFGMTKMSTKGQIVIPIEMRKEFAVGEKLLVLKSDNKLIIKKASEMDEQLKEDLEFARRTEEAYKEIDEGKGISMDFDDFMEEIKKW